MLEGSYINSGTSIDNEFGRVAIGRDVAIGSGVRIISFTHDHSDPHRRAGRISSADVTIEDGSWIGSSVVILPGAHIGHGCVVAAGAVVRGKLDHDCLYAGVPARMVKRLS